MAKGKKSILIQSPTGSGKTALTSHMIKTASEKGMRCWFIVHRRELIKQSMLSFNKVHLNSSVVANGFVFEPKAMVQICSIGSLQRRYHKLPHPTLIVWDECHHIGAAGWENIFKLYPGAYHIGLSATPVRLDGKGLGKYYQELIHGPSVSDLIEQGYLSKYKLFAPSNVDTSGLKSRAGDYKKEELVDLVNNRIIVGSAVKEYKKHCNDKRAIVFCASVEHSQFVTSEFRNAGIYAAHLDGTDDRAYRDMVIKKFTEGEIKVISNVDLFGEGFDVPAIEAVIQLRPTQSLGLHLQQVGRALRPADNKPHAIILDHVGNYERHGRPDDHREWSLDGVDKKKDKSETIYTCPECFAVQEEYWPCLECGFKPDKSTEDTRKPDEVDGELNEITAPPTKKQEQSKAKTFDDLVSLGRSRGYTRPELWAKHVFNARQAKRVKG